MQTYKEVGISCSGRLGQQLSHHSLQFRAVRASATSSQIQVQVRLASICMFACLFKRYVVIGSFGSADGTQQFTNPT